MHTKKAFWKRNLQISWIGLKLHFKAYTMSCKNSWETVCVDYSNSLLQKWWIGLGTTYNCPRGACRPEVCREGAGDMPAACSMLATSLQLRAQPGAVPVCLMEEQHLSGGAKHPGCLNWHSGAGYIWILSTDVCLIPLPGIHTRKRSKSGLNYGQINSTDARMTEEFST